MAQNGRVIMNELNMPPKQAFAWSKWGIWQWKLEEKISGFRFKRGTSWRIISANQYTAIFGCRYLIPWVRLTTVTVHIHTPYNFTVTATLQSGHKYYPLYSWNPGNPFCTCLKEGDSLLKHNSLISTITRIPFIAPTQGVSPSHIYYRPVLAAVALHSLLLYSLPPPSLPIGSGYFWTKPLPVSIPQQSHPSYSSCLHHIWRWNTQSVLKLWHINFRCRWITQNKE